MKHLGYYNGTYGEIEEMTIPMNDRVCYFGDGVYDASYSRNGNIFAIDEHIDRIYNSAALLRISIKETKEEMKAILLDMLSKMDTDENFVYWQVTRGTAMRDHIFPMDASSNLWIMMYPKKIAPKTKTLTAITRPDTRFLHCNIKTLNLIPSVIGAQEAKENGCDETIFHRDGIVTECSHCNVHILKDGIFRTHPADNLILPGIARAHLIKACKKLGIPVDETPFTLDELFDADEVIISSSSLLGLRTTTVDGKAVGGRAGELFERIQNEVFDEFDAYMAK